jgi:hypothetical protein
VRSVGLHDSAIPAMRLGCLGAKFAAAPGQAWCSQTSMGRHSKDHHRSVACRSAACLQMCTHPWSKSMLIKTTVRSLADTSASLQIDSRLAASCTAATCQRCMLMPTCCLQGCTWRASRVSSALTWQSRFLRGACGCSCSCHACTAQNDQGLTVRAAVNICQQADGVVALRTACELRSNARSGHPTAVV